MRRNFIIDQEIELLDGSDFLNTKVYSDTLQKMIHSSPTDRPFTIGLFGEWGSGKSSIIKTTKENLKKESHFKAKFAVFDAWKYSEDAFRRSFILSLSKELNIELAKQEYNLYENQTQKINEFKIKVSKSTWIILGVILLALLTLYIFVPWIKTHVLGLVSLISLYLLTSTLFLSLKTIINKDILIKSLNFIQSLVYTKYDEQRPLMFSPEQFSKAFEHIIDKATSSIDKLVIVIDNIDRCEKNYATELLSTIKGFLESRDKVLFILPVDESALKRHIKEIHKADDREADEFLRKFFNATLRIKPFHSSEIYVFAKQINDKYKLGFSDYTLDLVSKEFASNPRRIIQMFNNLTAELECFSDDTFIKTNETSICKLLILREEFPKFYYYLSKNPYLLNMSIPDMKSYFTNIGTQSLSDDIFNKALEIFLNKTQIITSGNSIKDLNQILSNSIVFNGIPTEIVDYIDNVQYDMVKKFIDLEATNKTVVIDYLIQQLDVYNERNVIGNSFVNILTILIDINSDYTLNITINKRVEEIIKPILYKIFIAINDLNKLIEYSWALMRQNRSYLLDDIILTTNKELENTQNEILQKKWVDTLIQAIKTYSDKRIIKKLSKSFKDTYQENRSIFNPTLGELQIASLVDREIFSTIIKNIDAIQYSNPYYQDLQLALNYSNPVLTVAEEIVAKINELHPSPLNKDEQDYIELISNINGLLSLIKVDFSNSFDQLKILGDTVWGDKRTPHRSYPQLRDYDTVTNYVDELIKNNGDITEILIFCFNIYRLTKNKVDIVPVLNKIKAANVYQTLINQHLIDLLDNENALEQLYPFILSDTSYSNENIKLIRKALLANESDNYLVDDNSIQNKIDEILNLINDDDSRKSALIDFLESMVSDKRIGKVLKTTIPVQGKDNILKLSNSLQSLAIDTILETNKIFDFSENLDFLKVIAETGDKPHTAALTNDIISKLQRADQLDNAIMLISAIKNINKTDANRIISELENKQSTPENKDEIKITIKNLKKTIDN